jgi:hypothetical protein
MDFPDGSLNLFVIEIGEPSQNELRVVLAEAELGEVEPLTFHDVDMGEGRSMIITDRSRHFELTWDGYVAYAVRNESYWKAEVGEPAFKSHLTSRVNSAFLQYVSATTFADDDYPGPLQHWALTSHTHCIDVVSVQPPRVVRMATKQDIDRPTNARQIN